MGSSTSRMKMEQQTKLEGRTQLVSYAVKHGLAKSLTEARKIELTLLREQVNEHRKQNCG